jgi:hypothetical protein
MNAISTTTRDRIEAQGFLGFSDEELSQFNLWLRFAPAICCLWTSIGVILASPVILGALVPFALLGGIFKSHPFDLIYNHGLRHAFNSPKLPAYPVPRRMACLTATVMLSITALGFQFGFPLIGYGIGGFMMVASFINVATGFCIPSYFYGLMNGNPVGEIQPEG